MTTFNQITIIGIGLIGSSIARVIKEKKLCKKLICFDNNHSYMEKAKELNIVDNYCANINDAICDADLIIYATPVSTYKNITIQIANKLKHGTIITDVGSVKKYVIDQINPYLPNGVEFIPGHPVAGTEKSGPEAGFKQLFEGRWFIFTPLEKTNQENLNKISKIWEEAGMKIAKMSPEHHDKVMAAVSHLPHLIAFSIVGTIDDLEDFEQQEIIKYSAGGFRDFTRIAGSDPTMWRDIFLTNKKMILELLQRFTEDLIALQRNIRWDQGEELFNLFSRTQKIRKEVIDANQDQPEREKRIIAQMVAE